MPRDLTQPAKPPDADPHVRWCGRGAEVPLPPPPIPIGAEAPVGEPRFLKPGSVPLVVRFFGFE